MNTLESTLKERNDRFRVTRDSILKVNDSIERSRLIAEWAVDETLDDLKPVLPPLPPAVIIQRRIKVAALGDKVKDEPEFWNRTDVQEFVNQKWKANLKNISNFEWLQWVKKHLDPSDTVRGVKVRSLLYEFVLYFGSESKREAPFSVLKYREKKDGAQVTG